MLLIKINSNLGGIEFGLDTDGKGQYRAVGASKWTPFLSGGKFTNHLYSGVKAKNGTHSWSTKIDSKYVGKKGLMLICYPSPNGAPNGVSATLPKESFTDVNLMCSRNLIGTGLDGALYYLLYSVKFNSENLTWSTIHDNVNVHTNIYTIIISE